MIEPGTRVYAIGDIHGRLDLLAALEGEIAADLSRSRPRRSVVVYLGDYIDRGPDSARVLDHLLDRPPPADRVVHLLGNHEDALLAFLDDAGAGAAWMSFGGRETLRSYGALPDRGPPAPAWLVEAQDALERAMPRRHRDFLAGLALRHAEGGYLFVHAGLRPDVPLDRQKREDLIWIREEFLRSEADYGCVVVHGHSIRREPEIRPNRIGIDTGACFTGRLTAVVLEGDARRFLTT
jgi:serine/threonine protein phosphatase 1